MKSEPIDDLYFLHSTKSIERTAESFEHFKVSTENSNVFRNIKMQNEIVNIPLIYRRIHAWLSIN